MERAIVDKNKITLYWGQGESAPEKMKMFRYGSEPSMKALIDHFPNSRDHLRYYHTRGAYEMDFSKQNLKRIHEDFGRVPVESGITFINELKRANEEFVDMIRKAQNAKTLPIDILPQYDYKVPPLGEYQHRGVILLNNVKRMPLFADCGLGKCVAPHQVITTSTGPITMKEVFEREGAIIQTEDCLGEVKVLETPIEVPTLLNGKQTWKKCDRVYREKLKKGTPLKRIKGTMSEETLATIPHRFLINKGEWSETVVKGDTLWSPSVINPKEALKKHFTNDEVLFFSWFLADGCDNLKTGTVITCMNTSDRKKLIRLATSLGFKACEQKASCAHVSISGMKRWREKLATHGYPMSKKLSADKFIPAFVFGLPRRQKKIFLNHYISKEGYIGTNGVLEVSSASRKTIYGLYQLLLGFGIVSKIRKKKAKATNSSNPQLRDYWLLQITGEHMSRFGEKIGLYHEHKDKRLRELVLKTRNPNKDILPCREEMETIYKRTGLSQGELFGKNGFLSCRKGGFSRRMAETFLKKHGEEPEAKEIKRLLEADVFFDTVENSESVELEEDMYVYDLMVPETHNYVIDGKWSHNTYMVLVSTEIQIKRGAIGKGKTLIAGKLATLETGWLEDAENFTDLKVAMLWSSKSNKEKKYEEIMEKLNDDSYDAYVINHDGLRIYEKELRQYGFDKVVVDESTILKGFHGMERHFKGGEFGRSLMRVSEKADWRVIMTGTPAPNGPQDLWGQFKFLNPEGFMIDPTWRDFMSSYFKKVYFGATNVRNTGQVYKTGEKKGLPKYPDTPIGELVHPHLKEGEPLNPNTPSKFEVRKESISEIHNLIAPWVYRLKLRECVDVPKDYRMERFVQMNATQKKHYKDMKEKLVVEIENEKQETTEIRAAIELSAYGKLRQITGGFIIDHEENPIPMKKNPKLDMLDQMVEEEIDAEEKIVIFCEFRWEVETITSRYKKYGAVSVFGGNTTKKNLDNIKKFKKGGSNVRIIVMHPQSASHGVNLTEACYLIFYSINFSAEFNYQAVGRILRANQTKPMFIYYLLCRGTIDTLAYDKIIKKNEDQDFLLDGEGIEKRSHRDLLEACREGI